ncbi:MAG: protease [bacterium]|nr:protease [bacterium]
MYRLTLAMALIVCLLAGAPASAEETRLLRNPDISSDHIAFVYANDVWVAKRSGSSARRLTTSGGAEVEPHFSPDGAWIAFSGQYDGNTDVYIVPTEGGEPTRLTWHPGQDTVRGWTPDGQNVLFASGRVNAPIQVPRFFTVSIEGGMPTQLPLPRAFEGQFSADGAKLVYQMVLPWEAEFRNYRGGQNNPIRIIDLDSLEVEKLPWSADERPNDHSPVWVGDTIYFLSDRDWAVNVWTYDLGTGQLEQRTHFKEFDCKRLEAGPDEVIFENGGWLYTLTGDTPQKVSLTVRGDFPWARTHWEEVGEMIRGYEISPKGKRALFEARGEIFTVPAEKGSIRNLTRTSGVAERAPAWSPDGQYVSWFSDADGEYSLTIADQFGEVDKTIELESPTFYYTPVWSPDNKHLAYGDADRNLWIVNIESGDQRLVDNEGFAHPVRLIRPAWAPDSKWLTYSKRLTNQYNAVFVVDVTSNEAPVQVTDGLSDSHSPVFDASGKYLYFLGSTDFGMGVGWLDMSSYPYTANYSIYAAVLAADEANPLAPESDDEEAEEEDADEGEDEDSEEADSDDTDEADKEEDEEDVKVTIDWDGLQQRIVAIDVPARPYSDLRTGTENTLYYLEAVENEDGRRLHRYSLEDREAKKILDGANGYEISADGEMLLYSQPGNRYAIAGADAPVEAGKGALNTSGMRMKVDPQTEWQQIFNEAVRYQRDYFYVENVHGLDLDWAKEAYGSWLPSVRHRADLTYILDILGGETSIGHSFTGGGDTPDVDRVPVGLLGADLEIDSGHYRIAKIYTGESWNPDLSAPLAGPGIDAKIGDYLLAVDGHELIAEQNPYSLFDRTADRQTVLTLNNTPDLEEAREVTVVPVANEGNLRRRDWVEGNRRKVDELSEGRLAYVHLPNTAGAGYTYFNRYYFAQQDRQGAIIDERYNQGGSIADHIVDLLSRTLFGYFNNPVGDRQPWTAPNAAIWGPKVLIINDAAGSGGDMLPYMFHHRGIGPMVGTRTWGGLVGIWDVPALVDGGFITAPRGGFYDKNGEWAVENEGIPPDYEVEQEPKLVAEGHDPQLEKAVEVALELLETQGVTHPAQPADPVRVKRAE